MSTARAETVKLWLGRYRQQMENIERLSFELDALESKATSPGAPSLDGLPRTPGFEGDRMGGIVGRLDEIRAEIEEAQAEATATRREIESAIKKITGPHWPDRRAVLRFRYLLLLPWEDVNDALFGAKRDFLDREDSYMRRTYRLHGEALAALMEFVPLEQGQEMKFQVFKNLEEEATDFKTVLLEIRTADREARDITRSTESRLVVEKRQAATRAAEITAITADPARSATIRRMAQAELDELRQRNYGPSTAEQAAFDGAVAELQQAAEDARALQTKLSELLKEARDELEEIKKSTINDPANNLSILSGWPAGLRRDFAAMLTRAGGEAQK